MRGRPIRESRFVDWNLDAFQSHYRERPLAHYVMNSFSGRPNKTVFGVFGTREISWSDDAQTDSNRDGICRRWHVGSVASSSLLKLDHQSVGEKRERSLGG